MRKLFANPYLLLTLTVLSWSGNMVIGRGIRGDIPPLTLAFWRWVIAFLLVLPLALPHLKTQWPLLKKGWKPLLVLGLLGVGGYNTFAYLALQHTSATNATLLNSFIPIATIAISWAFLGKHLRRPEAIGVLISLCGALTIVSRGDLGVLANFNLNLGDIWMLIAVLDWAIYTVALAWRPAGVLASGSWCRRRCSSLRPRRSSLAGPSQLSASSPAACSGPRYSLIASSR